MTSPKTKEKLLKTLSIRSISTFANRGSEFIVNIPVDTEVDDLLEPTYWTHVAGTTFQGILPIVHALWDDKSQYVKLFVREYEHAYASVEVLEHHDFRDKAPKVVPVSEPKFKRDWTGMENKFRILRIADGAVMETNVKDKETAIKVIADLERKHK